MNIMYIKQGTISFNYVPQTKFGRHVDQFHVTAAIMVQTQRSIGVKNVNKTSLHL